MQTKLQKAFENTALECIIDTVPKMPDHTFSKGFEKEMNSLIKNGKPVEMRRISPKKMYICIIAAIIAACLMTLSVGAVRDFFKNFFMEIFSTHTNVQSNDIEKTPEHIINKYVINISSDFNLTDAFESDIFNKYEYYDSYDHYVFFTQTVKSIYDVNINTEEHNLSYIEINDSDGYIIDLDNNEYLITWENNNYVFDITGNVGKNQLIELAESVQKVE